MGGARAEKCGWWQEARGTCGGRLKKTWEEKKKKKKVRGLRGGGEDQSRERKKKAAPPSAGELRYDHHLNSDIFFFAIFGQVVL